MALRSSASLPWLPCTPADFKDRCRGVDVDGGSIGQALRWLAGHALGTDELDRLSRTVRTRRAKDGGEIVGLEPLSLGLIANGTTSLLAPVLAATAVRYGFDCSVVEGAFGQSFLEATSPDSTIHAATPQAIIVALDHRGLPGLGPGLSRDEGSDVAAAIAHVAALCRGLREGMSSTLIVQNVACPPGPLFGSHDSRIRGTQRRRIERFNRDLNDLLDGLSAVLLDVDGLARTVGTERWFDERQWHVAKLPFAHELAPLFADHVLRLVAAVRGHARKCLVLDLDHTLWGGVVGDDGIEGLTLGQGNPVGEAFVAVQQAAARLRSRGVILAVCSKNDLGLARAAFQNHPDMVLRLDDIAVFQANWQDKATNLRAIARSLGIGTESLVLLDDNPAERALVRLELPEVAVPELGADPADYPGLLLSAGYFESVNFTEEDRERSARYRGNAARAELEASATDMAAYLTSLGMVLRCSPFDATSRARIAQLTQRSNQFNLTTRRYDEAAIAAFERRPDAFTLQVRLADRCGDNGMISVIICTLVGTEWVIDTWLMSCRVLQRGVEAAVMDVLVATARSRGITRITGLYRPSGRNGLVRDHYRNLGFTKGDTDGDVEAWHLDPADHLPRRPPMDIVLGEGIHGFPPGGGAPS